MHVTKLLGVQGVALALMSLGVPKPILATPHVPSMADREIVQSLDAALRSPDSVEALGALPWADRAAMVGPQLLAHLRDCKLTSIHYYRGVLTGAWSPTDAAKGKCEPPGADGYVVFFHMRRGQIARLNVEEAVTIMVTGQ